MASTRRSSPSVVRRTASLVNCRARGSPERDNADQACRLNHGSLSAAKAIMAVTPSPRSSDAMDDRAVERIDSFSLRSRTTSSSRRATAADPMPPDSARRRESQLMALRRRSRERSGSRAIVASVGVTVALSASTAGRSASRAGRPSSAVACASNQVAASRAGTLPRSVPDSGVAVRGPAKVSILMISRPTRTTTTRTGPAVQLSACPTSLAKLV